MKPTLALSSLLLLNVATMAQGINPLPRRGVMHTFEVGVVFENDSNALALKNAGRTGALTPYPGVASGFLRDYPISALEAFIGNGWTAVVTALSSPNNLLPVVYDSVQNLFRIWQVDNGTAFAILCMSIENAAGDSVVYGYYPSNPGFPLQLRNGYYHEFSATDWTGPLAPPSSGPSVICGIDVGLGLIHASDGQLQPSLVNDIDHLYFSLTPASAILLWNNPTMQQGRDPNAPIYTGGTIFDVSYSPSTGLISSVTVLYDYTDLNLGLNDNVDALAIALDPGQGTHGPFGDSNEFLALVPSSSYCLFSTDAENEQLWLVAEPQSPAGVPLGRKIRPLRKKNGGVIAGPGGIAGGVGGACCYDPETLVKSQNGGVPKAPIGPPDLSTFLDFSAFATDLPVIPSDGLDEFTLHGGITDWNGATPSMYYMTLVVVANEDYLHPKYYPLPNRLPNEHAYDFQQEVSWEWSPEDENSYEMMVVAVSAAVPSTTDLTFITTMTRKK